MREGMILKAASLRGLSVVASIHGAEFIPFAARHRRLVASVLRSANAITCLSSDIEAVVRQLAPNRHVEIIPNPVADPERYVPAAATDQLVVFAGELGIRKGADILAAAWPLVSAQAPAAKCVMVGPATKLVLPDLPGLAVHDPISHSEVASLISRARVVALPSRAEGMPMLLTEALAAGRPFVSTPVGGIPELAHSPGMLVPVGNAGELAKALIGFLRDPALAQQVGERAARSGVKPVAPS